MQYTALVRCAASCVGLSLQPVQKDLPSGVVVCFVVPHGILLIGMDRKVKSMMLARLSEITEKSGGTGIGGVYADLSDIYFAAHVPNSIRFAVQGIYPGICPSILQGADT